MREMKYVLLFIIGILMTHLLFQMADEINPDNIGLNTILELVVCFCYGMLLLLFYYDNGVKK
jgi:hypothetical protein